MAGASEKKRQERNNAKLALLRNIFLSGLAVFVVGRGARFQFLKHPLSLNAVINGVLGTIGCATMYSWLQSAALGGGDLAEKGMASYLHDVFYLSAFTLFVGAAYDKIWKFVICVIVLFVLYFLMTTVVPMIRSVSKAATGEGREPSAEEKARAEKAEKRRERRRMKSGF